MFMVRREGNFSFLPGHSMEYQLSGIIIVTIALPYSIRELLAFGISNFHKFKHSTTKIGWS